MPEMLPCPLSLNRYNPTFRPTEGEGDEGSGGGGGGGDYLDLDRDYEVISQLRRGLMLCEEEVEGNGCETVPQGEHIY